MVDNNPITKQVLGICSALAVTVKVDNAIVMSLALMFVLSSSNTIIRLNSTSRLLPFANQSVDRIVALESAQHFKKLDDFISESKRILNSEGILVFAIPIVTQKVSTMKDLGILTLTWTSEHFTLDFLTSKIKHAGFKIEQIRLIGKMSINQWLTTI